jgi:hypothetical protein
MFASQDNCVLRWYHGLEFQIEEWYLFYLILLDTNLSNVLRIELNEWSLCTTVRVLSILNSDSASRKLYKDSWACTCAAKKR